jgi:hypothetical protein
MFGPMHVPLFWHVVEHIANGEKKSSLIGENNCELGWLTSITSSSGPTRIITKTSVWSGADACNYVTEYIYI